ncbi:hypothetical protein SDC9_141859 [bioreactor metagenome]|uniref:Uncharacterized protein n=1 Tax=bioreactor metagenome TaxID=1076179 RepID=A0A645DZI3_9ZZZZ
MRKAVLLRRREFLRAEKDRVGVRIFVINARNAKVDELDFAFIRDDDIARLYVAVDHGRRLRVQVSEDIAKLSHYIKRLLLRDMVFTSPVLERGARHVFTHAAKHCVVFVFA